MACNTATSAAIGELRARWPDRVIIGIEPALKLAVSRHPGGCIGVLATEATLREEKFAALLQRCAENCHILKCPCPELVEFVERGALTGPALERCLAARLAPVLAAGPDALVLGCTHFPFAAGAIRRVVGPDADLPRAGKFRQIATCSPTFRPVFFCPLSNNERKSEVFD